jgi:hypothetical protein
MRAFKELKGYRTRSGSRNSHKTIISIRGCEFWLSKELILTLEGATSKFEKPKIYPERISPVIKKVISDY